MLTYRHTLKDANNPATRRRKELAPMYTEKKLRRLKMARRIMFRREELGMNTGDLAAALGLSYAYIRDVEYGFKGITTDTLIELSQVLKVPADYLLLNTRKHFTENDEIAAKRQDIADFLCDCDARELEYVEKIIHIFVDDLRERRPPVKNV